MDLSLKNKSVLIAGATGLLGSAISLAMAEEGAHLILGGRNLEALQTLRTKVLQHGAASATPRLWDLASESSTREVVEQTLTLFPSLDIFISAAGAAQGGVFWEIDDAAWQRHLEAKLFGTLRALRAVGPAMIQQGHGRIVLVVGNSARQPEPRMLPGAVANSGLLAVVHGLAKELGPHGVHINAVNPGPVQSPRWQNLMQQAAERDGITVEAAETDFLRRAALQRLATADEVARHVIFLASDAAAHMSGTSVTVDGGSTYAP